ncbi:MAG: Alginate biosynthesis protein AlgA [Thermoanaerobacterium thermosaccharolyticum]|jgi:mannose-1-phosphate guanylyltransferase
MLCGLIMAGGKGERFWPLSTDEKPKQFLKLLGEKTMIQMTVERLIPLIPLERIFVVTAKRYVNVLEKQLPNLPKDNIIVEPVGRNTAPCIALSAFYIEKKYNNASIVVVPSDHLVVESRKFRDTIEFGYEHIKNDENGIITIGIEPDRPETGYGYIQFNSQFTIHNAQLGMHNSQLGVHNAQCTDGNSQFTVHDSQCTSDSEVAASNEESDNSLCIYKVERFVEKPDIDKARKYISQGNFLWNCGMFIWKCSTVIELTKRYLNNTYNILKDVFEAEESEFNRVLKKRYPDVDNISVDYGIMEKADNIYVIPSNFGWDDIGTWHAVERYREKDEDNNVCIGNIKSLKSSNNIVYSKDKPIVVVGMEDVFVVESDDIIFVGKKKDIDRIKEIKKNVSK